MKIKLQLISLLLLTVPVIIFSQPAAGYYDAAVGKSGAALKTQLSNIISSGAIDVGYDGLYTVYKTSDLLPNGKIWDMYSMKVDGTANYYFTPGSSECGSYNSEGDCYNREHTFCDSWLGEASPQRSDAHHLIPTDGYVNNRRSSYPHGKVGSATWTSSNGSKLGSSDASTGYSGTVFEPIDQFKGDFARMYFYVATRYESKIAGWVSNGSASELLAGNSYPAYKEWFYKLMVQWNALDPVSQKEIDRNNAVYAVQKNRNPFIDYPELVDYIWGSKTTVARSYNSSTTPWLNYPSNASLVDFGNVYFSQTDTASVYIKGINLTGDLTLTLTGTSASKFSLPQSIVSVAEATSGYKLVINYTASAIETSTAQLNISGGGITAVQVNLTAKSTDQFMSLAATNVTESSFTANWSSSALAIGYSLDVYNLTGTATGNVTLLEDDFLSGLPTGWSSLGYYDNATSSTLKMGSGSQNCIITTPTVDLSQATVLTVKSKQYNNDTGAKLWVVAGTNDTLATLTNAVDYQTFTINIPAKQANTTLNFSVIKGARVYFDYTKLVTTGTTQTPVSISGYPKSVGNVLSYDVTNLENNTDYYYTVTPEGNSTGKSSPVSVKTLVANNLNYTNPLNVYWYKNNNDIVLQNAPAGSVISVFNSFRQRIYETANTGDKTAFKLNEKGIYIVKIKFDNSTITEKVIY